MQLKIGDYELASNSCWVSIRRDGIPNEAGVPYIERIEVDVEGYLDGTSQSDLTTKEGALVDAARKGNQDLVLYRNDGGRSGINLQNGKSLSGIFCLRGPSFTERVGAEYANQRKYSMTFRADFPIINDKTRLVSFREKMAFSGGGPVFGYKNAINGPPQKQLLWFQVPYRLVQSGEAVGFLDKPRVPPPAFPEALMQAPEITETSPDRMNDKYARYAISWSYVMESDQPLIAIPTLWR